MLLSGNTAPNLHEIDHFGTCLNIWISVQDRGGVFHIADIRAHFEDLEEDAKLCHAVPVRAGNFRNPDSLFTSLRMPSLDQPQHRFAFIQMINSIGGVGPCPEQHWEGLAAALVEVEQRTLHCFRPAIGGASLQGFAEQAIEMPQGLTVATGKVPPPKWK
ncbi:MAG: hypothetical protein R6T92_03655, partial [Desulfosalsimonadaceae bacterium]